MRAPLLGALAALVAATATPAATLHVCPDGSGEYPDLHAAVAAASSGDTIELCDGVFTGPENVDLHFGDRDLVLRSLHGPEYTTIDFAWLEDGGGGFDELLSHPGIFLEAGTTTRIEGVTLSGAGYRLSGDPGEGSTIQCLGGTLVLDRIRIRAPFSYGGHSRRGGGVFTQDGTLVAMDCTFEGTRAWIDGGAIFSEASRVELRGCTFSHGSSGGANLRLDGGVITDCMFESNRGLENPGVVVRNESGELTVSGTTFRSSFAVGLANRGTVLVQDCLFDGNVADEGPAITNSGVATVMRSTFRENLAGIWVGAVMNYGTMSVEECLFLRNQSGYSQFWSATAASYSGELSVRHCTFVGNRRSSSARAGSALRFGAGATGIIEQTIVTQSEHYSAVGCEGAPDLLSIMCCDFFGNEQGDWVGCVEGLDGSAGNFSSAPLFCDTAAEDFHLRSTSPCAPPQSGDCGQIGAFGVGCGTTALRPSSWGRIKGMYR